MGLMSEERSTSANDSLYQRLQEKHMELRLRHLKDAQKSLEVDYSVAFKKMHDLSPSLDLISDEIAIALNEIEWRCDECGVQHVGQLLKDVRAMMNRQLREAYASLEAGYKSAFHRVQEEANNLARRQRETNNGEMFFENAVRNSSSIEEGSQENVVAKKNVCTEERKKARQGSVRRTFSLIEAFSTTTSLFAEMTAVLLGCEVVRIFLYDEHKNLKCCARFPLSCKKGDPMAGTDMELILAKEIHRVVCLKCIAVNGRLPQSLTLSERDRVALESELNSVGWKSMTSCLIFPIFSSKESHHSYGMIHAVNKQGVSADKPGTFDESDEVFMSVTARLLGCLLARYPVEYFSHPVGQTIQKCVSESAVKDVIRSHLPPLLEDEVEEAAHIGNKANQMCRRVLVYRAPINAIYQTRLMRKKTRKLEALEMVDKALSTVEFDLEALEELWQDAHQENTVMYQQCQSLNEQLNTLQVLLRNVLDGIGASRTLGSVEELGNYLQSLELYARQENILMLTELISKVLVDAKKAPFLPTEVQQVNNRRISENEIIGIERRLAQTSVKLKFGAATPQNVRTYACDPQRKRDQVKFFNDLAERRTKDAVEKNEPVSKTRYQSETEGTKAKKVNKPVSTLLHFGPVDYASRRVFRLGNN